VKLPNIIVRTLTGIVYIAILLGGIMFSQYLFLAVFAAVTFACLTEFYTLLNTKYDSEICVPVHAFGGTLLFGCVFLYFSQLVATAFAFIPYLLYLIALFISSLYSRQGDILKKLSCTLLGQVYVAGSMSALNVLAFGGEGNAYKPLFLLSMLVFIWVNDTFAYLVGSRIGKHRLFERISPQKSWEGAIGGALFAVAAAILFFFCTSASSFSLYRWLGFAAFTVLFANFGDLFESLVKRKLGVKDSGNILPGHGGLLDRFDSIMGAAPALALYLYLLTIINNFPFL